MFDAIVTYYLGWEKGASPIATYAFPLTSFGTLGVVLGMYMCAHIIESSTKEVEWQPRKTESEENPSENPPRRILWVQKSQTVGDQGFESFALYSPYLSRGLMTSQRQPRSPFHSLTRIATVLSIAGTYSGSKHT